MKKIIVLFSVCLITLGSFAQAKKPVAAKKPVPSTPAPTIMAWKKTGVNCIGIKDAEGRFIISPPEETIIDKGMKVLVLGTKQQIQDMKGNIS